MKFQKTKLTLKQLILSQLKFNMSNQCINAYEVMASSETLLMAYRDIKSKPGNMTKGTDSETLDGINLN